MGYRLQYLAVLCIVSVFSSHFVLADTWTWDGESPTTDAWSDWTNWVGNSSAPFSDPGTDLIFGDSIQVLSSNNLGVFQLRDLTFAVSSSPVLLGDRLEVFRSVVNSSSVTRGVYNPIRFGADVAFRAANGDLQFLGTTHNAGYTLTTEGSARIYLQSLAGSGGIDVHGPGQTFFGGSNAYTGATRIYGGSLLAFGTDSLRNSTSLLVQGSSIADIHGASGFFAADTVGRQATVNGANALLNAPDMIMAGTSNSLSLSGGGRATALWLQQQGQANSVLVDGSGSRLTAEHEYSIGGSGTENRLWITGGGGLGLATMLMITSSFSHVLVRDSGSIITGQALVVGEPGTGNMIEVRDGGAMKLGYGVFVDGVCNTVRVQGAGALIQSPMLLMGFSGAARGAHLDVSDGGQVDVAQIGTMNSSNTLITARGAGTVIGPSSGAGTGLTLQGVDERIEISDGARVTLSPVLAGTRGTLNVWGSGSSVIGTGMSGMMGTDNSISVSNGAQLDLGIFVIVGDRNRIEVTGAGTTWTNAGEISLASANQGRLQVTDGAELTGGSLTAIGATDTHILFSGPDTRITLGGVTAMAYGVSSVVVSNGARVSSGMTVISALSGNLDIVGSGTAWHIEGDLVTAVPTRIGDGALLSSFNTVGYAGGIDVTGSGTVWSNRGSLMMFDHSSPLHVSEGARMDNHGDLNLISANATVQGPGSELHVGGDILSGRGLSVLGGGAINSSSNLLMASMGSGNYLVSGTGSRLDVGGQMLIHNITFSILNDGDVSANLMTIGHDGILLLNGGELTVDTLSKTSSIVGGSFDFHAGTLNVSSTEYHSLAPFEVGDGAQTAVLNLTGSSSNQHVFTGGLRVREHSGLIGEGTIHGNVQIEGVLDIGQSAGYMEIDGLLTFDQTAEVYMEIFGEDDDEYDRLQATSIAYNGVLQVNFMGFTPADGSRFQLFDAASFSGSFSATNIMGVFSAGFDATSGEVFVIAAIPEANTLVLLLGGLAFLSRRRRRRL